MEAPEFNAAIDEQLERSREMLFAKNAHYNAGEDKLRGFKATAALRGTTPQGALAGMMAKHTLSVYDMCESGLEYPIEVWNEKISDHINYLLLLRAVVEENEGRKTAGVELPNVVDDGTNFSEQLEQEYAVANPDAPEPDYRPRKGNGDFNHIAAAASRSIR